jgi:hypothetical protein
VGKQAIEGDRTGSVPGTAHAVGESRRIPMPDLLLALATASFFALSWGYARLCEKL